MAGQQEMSGGNLVDDGDSDIIMAEDPESASDGPTEGTEVAEQASGTEFEFESTTSTVAMLEPVSDVQVPDDTSSHRIASGPALHGLPALTQDEDAASQDALANPQDGSESEQAEANLELLGDEVGQEDVDGVQGGGGDGDDGHSDSPSDGSSQSWEAAWNSVPSSNQNNWSVPLPPFPDDPGPPVPLLDPHVIRVVFRYEMLVEIRFNPGLRAGPPQTRILSRHMSHVSTNF